MRNEAAPRRVLITGANGHLGFMLFEHLSALEGWQVVGIDITAPRHPAIVQADIGSPDQAWTQILQDCDAIVHLAADRSPEAEWSSSIHSNIDNTLVLFEAAARNGVGRMVFASSNWIFGGHRFGTKVLNSKLTPKPVNPYGVSKLFGERLAQHYAKCRDMSCVSLRIGWLQWTHDNQPGPHMAMGRWGQHMWLSVPDFLQGVRCAIEADVQGHVAVNLVSNNEGMRWDLTEAKASIGYVPLSKSSPQITWGVRCRDALSKLRQVGLPKLLAALIPENW